MLGCFFLLVVATLLSVNSETQLDEFVVPEITADGQSIGDSNLWWTGKNNAILGSPVGTYELSDTVVLETSPCEPGKHWSRSRQICVDSSYGLMNAGGNSKRSGKRYATGRRLPTRRKRCTKSKAVEERGFGDGGATTRKPWTRPGPIDGGGVGRRR